MGSICAKFRPHLAHISFTDTPFGPFEHHSCPRGMSRGKKSQQSWACGPPRHCLLFFVAATSPKSQQKAKHVAVWVRFLPSQFLGRQNPRKHAFFFVSFFWDVKKSLPYTPVGADWDAIVIRLGIHASRCVLNGTQLRSE